MNLAELLWWQNAVLLGGIVLAMLLESFVAALPFARGRERAAHIGRNLGFSVLSTVFSSIVLGGVAVLAFGWAQRNGLGVLQLLLLPGWIVLPLGFLLTDLGDYCFHRLMHTHRILWLFHCVHHSDPHLDVSTSLRTHPGQSFAALAWKLLLALALGIPLWVIALHDVIQIAVSLLHHSNLRLPPALDRGLRLLIITPSLHRTHHSPRRERTNSNYGGLLVCWDRLLGTYCPPVDAAEPERVGLDALDHAAAQSIWGMLVTPWRVRGQREL